jgi:hypothetical protein
MVRGRKATRVGHATGVGEPVDRRVVPDTPESGWAKSHGVTSGNWRLGPPVSCSPQALGVGREGFDAGWQELLLEPRDEMDDGRLCRNIFWF